MINPESFTLSDYLNRLFPCSCGKKHSTSLKDVEISASAVRKLPEYIRRYGHKKSFFVYDRNTYRACGRQVQKVLDEAGCDNSLHILSSEDVVPDEATIGELMVAFDREADLMIAVGTGSINDMCKFISCQMGVEYFIVATAPSMDGFALEGAPLITGHMKTTYPAHAPQVIIGDLDVLCQAPMVMVTAGVGDTLGKYTCLLDWKLSHIVNGEYYCPLVVRMVEVSLKKMVGSIGRVRTCDPETVATVMEALVLTGIAMSFVGNSRPASGSEHHLSHYWEMLFLFEGRKPVLHGTKVGIGAVATGYLYGVLGNSKIDFEKARDSAKSFDYDGWKNKMRKTYGEAAQGVIALEEKTGKNAAVNRLARIDSAEKHWPEIVRAIGALPPAGEIERMLSELGAPVNPAQIGVSPQLVYNGILVSKELRDRYTLFQLLWDL